MNRAGPRLGRVLPQPAYTIARLVDDDLHRMGPRHGTELLRCREASAARPDHSHSQHVVKCLHIDRATFQNLPNFVTTYTASTKECTQGLLVTS